MSKITYLSIVQYFDDRSSTVNTLRNPSWNDVESAIRKMDNYYFPIVLLGTHVIGLEEDGFEDEDSFHVMGGNGRFALFSFTGEWQYERESGGDEDVRLWDSDQGYICQEKNILYDISRVLHVVNKFYNTGSYNDLTGFYSQLSIKSRF